MTTQSLEEFFSEKRAHAAPADIDWETRKQEWLRAIDALYLHVRELLQHSIEVGSLAIDSRPKNITEDFIGTYTVEELVLRVGDEIAVFSPKGRNIVGATGRVDLIGEMGTVSLILQPGPRWAVVTQRVPTVKVVPLDRDSLLAALRNVMRP